MYIYGVSVLAIHRKGRKERQKTEPRSLWTNTFIKWFFFVAESIELIPMGTYSHCYLIQNKLCRDKHICYLLIRMFPYYCIFNLCTFPFFFPSLFYELAKRHIFVSHVHYYIQYDIVDLLLLFFGSSMKWFVCCMFVTLIK